MKPEDQKMVDAAQKRHDEIFREDGHIVSTFDTYEMFRQADKDRTELLRIVSELEKLPKFHHPDCKYWKWDWRYSWHETDCNCDEVAGPSEPINKEGR